MINAAVICCTLLTVVDKHDAILVTVPDLEPALAGFYQGQGQLIKYPLLSEDEAHDSDFDLFFLIEDVAYTFRHVAYHALVVASLQEEQEVQGQSVQK